MDEPTTLDRFVKHEPAPTRLADRYEVEALLGAGGMGSVFLARDLELDELVAVKMLLHHDAHLLARFREEVRLARRVTHRNVARTFDIGEHRGEKFLTMEYIPGVSLARHVEREGPLSAGEIVRIGRAMCAGLGAAHEAGVIHRDFKPGNVMIADDGRVVVTDFGLAVRAHTSDEKIAGTLAYMAPEQFAGLPVDARADIYALGAVLFRMATGERPFEEAPNERKVTPNPCDRRAHLPEELGHIVVRCLSTEPDGRYATAADVGRALDEIDLAHDAPPPTRRVYQRFEGSNVRTIAIVLDDEEDELGRGLRSNILEQLAQHPVLRVVTDDPEATVAMHVVGAPDRIRVDLRLSSGGVDFFAVSIVEPWSRALELTQIVSSRILAAFALDMVDAPRVPPLPASLVERYLKVRLQLRTRDPDLGVRAVQTLESMMADAPEHPLLFATLAQARSRASFFVSDMYEQAMETALEAIRVAPDVAEAHAALGVTLFQGTKSAEAAARLLRALELAPGLADARLTLGVILTEAGAAIDGIRFCEDAALRAPSLATAWFDIARVWVLLGKLDRAEAAHARITASYASVLASAGRIRVAGWYRDADALRKYWQEVAALPPTMPIASVAKLFVDVMLNGAAPRAAWEQNAQVGSPRRLVFGGQILAELGALRHDWPLALEGIEMAVGHGLQDVLWLERCPLFDELLGERRYEQMRDVVRGRAREVLEVLDART